MSTTASSISTTIHNSVTTEERSFITSNATAVGLQAAAVASTVAGVAVVAANHFSPTFRHRLGVSGKTSFVAMSGLAAFSIAAEQDLLRAGRNPSEYIARVKGGHHVTTVGARPHAAIEHMLPLWQQAANFVHDHPFRTVASTALPLVGAIYYEQNKNPNIHLSQKIMHTRIYGQGTCVVLLLSTMAIYDYMSKRGPYV
ncbi:Aste57867_21526 [Aphanomyces stellatus]|uniref:Aste57867_21526 protein n=1 Tax=Aphanomyces stellatus TaxID=120398 RepID=A0A485LJ48_9STRA|nr:hypothetical protein As57867_021457 [Aphanomyces stellatus]VFT98196.1 Aste57867_21526 [Aphanomyces stellatus]